MQILIANAKGGVGKTTLAVHLAGAFAERGLRVAALDVDEQAGTAHWLGRAAPHVAVRTCRDPEALVAHAAELHGACDLLLIDTPAALTAPVARLLPVVDLVLLPILPSLLDIRATYCTARMIYRTRFARAAKLGAATGAFATPGATPPLITCPASTTSAAAASAPAADSTSALPAALVVLNRAQSRTHLARVAAAAIQQYGFPVSRVAIEARTAYGMACERGTFVWRLGRAAADAAAEMAQFIDVVAGAVPDSILARYAAARGASNTLPATANSARQAMPGLERFPDVLVGPRTMDRAVIAGPPIENGNPAPSPLHESVPSQQPVPRHR